MNANKYTKSVPTRTYYTTNIVGVGDAAFARPFLIIILFLFIFFRFDKGCAANFRFDRLLCAKCVFFLARARMMFG